MAVKITDQTNKLIFSKLDGTTHRLNLVVRKLIEAKIDLIPAKWREKIAISILKEGCLILLERGGYTVHPVPGPVPINIPLLKNIKEGGRSQNLKLLRRGKIMSGAPNIKGISQLANPPIIIGIIIKKIIKKAWEVIKELKRLEPNQFPKNLSSMRIKSLILNPIAPAQIPKYIYREPISLWLDENPQRFKKFMQDILFIGANKPTY